MEKIENSCNLCRQCLKKIDNISKPKNFCSVKCYDKYRYDNNINGRKDKLRAIDKLKKQRSAYIKKLSAQELLNEVRDNGI